MYFWSISGIVKLLAEDQISEELSLRYFLASSLLLLITQYISLWWGAVVNLLFYFELLVVIVIVIFGCYKAFEANGGSEGRAFILKAVCLSLPVGMRVATFSFGFGLLLYLFWETIFLGGAFAAPQRAAGLIGYAATVGFNIWYWWMLVNGFKKIRRIEQAP